MVIEAMKLNTLTPWKESYDQPMSMTNRQHIKKQRHYFANKGYKLLDRSHSDWHEMVPHCGFDLHFSNNE